MSIRSSIFSFSTLTKDFRLPKAGLLAIAIILVVNFVLEALPLMENMPSPYFPRHQISRKHMTLKAYIEDGMNPEVLFIGSSIADMGFDVIEFEKYLQIEGGIYMPAFNFGIAGADSWTQLNLLKYLLIPETNIKYLFFGITHWDFKAGIGRRDTQEKFLDSPFFLSQRDNFRPRAWVRSFLNKNLESYKIREALWPNFLVEEKNSEDKTWLTTKMSGKLYHGLYKGQQPIKRLDRNWMISRYKQFPEEMIKPLRDGFSNYSIGGYRMERLKDIILLCKENNITLILVNMPILTERKHIENTVYQLMLEEYDGRNMMEMFDEKFTEVCSEYELPCINFGDKPIFTVGEFTDPLHLYQNGARRMSRMLGEFFLEDCSENCINPPIRKSSSSEYSQSPLKVADVAP